MPTKTLWKVQLIQIQQSVNDKQPSSVFHQPKVIITNSYESFILLKVINVSTFFGALTTAKTPVSYIMSVHLPVWMHV
jgi:hypothetical protein